MNASITKALEDLKTSVDNITNDSAGELTRVTAELNDLKAKVAAGELDNEQIASAIEGHATTINTVATTLKNFETATAPVANAVLEGGASGTGATKQAESSLSTSAPHSSTITPGTTEPTIGDGEPNPGTQTP